MKFDLSKPYLLPWERDEFQRLRESGEATIFDTQPCKACGAEVPKCKIYCNQQEYEQRLTTLRKIRDLANEIIDGRWQEKIGKRTSKLRTALEQAPRAPTKKKANHGRKKEDGARRVDAKAGRSGKG